MNIQPTVGDSLEDCEGPGDWEHWQQLHIIPAIVPAACIRSLRAVTRTRSMPHSGQAITKPFAERSKSAEVSSMSRLRPEGDDEIQSTSQGNLESLGVLPSQYRCTLSLVAYRVLGDKHLAEDAVQRCLLSASRNVPQFESVGAFRSWLVRVVIDEALLILHDREWVTHVLRTDQDPSYSIDPESPVKPLF
jgi:hypothetical protein